MGYTHEFGIINKLYDVNTDKYEPEKYNCISIPGEDIEPIFSVCRNMKTYWHNRNTPGFGLVECGITLIPPESLSNFRESVLKACNKTDSVLELSELILRATKLNKYLIHFGI